MLAQLQGGQGGGEYGVTTAGGGKDMAGRVVVVRSSLFRSLSRYDRRAPSHQPLAIRLNVTSRPRSIARCRPCWLSVTLSIAVASFVVILLVAAVDKLYPVPTVVQNVRHGTEKEEEKFVNWQFRYQDCTGVFAGLGYRIVARIANF